MSENETSNNGNSSQTQKSQDKPEKPPTGNTGTRGVEPPTGNRGTFERDLEKMKNRDLWASYEFYTSELTKYSRQLAFAAAAICWFFKKY